MLSAITAITASEKPGFFLSSRRAYLRSFVMWYQAQRASATINVVSPINHKIRDSGGRDLCLNLHSSHIWESPMLLDFSCRGVDAELYVATSFAETMRGPGVLRSCQEPSE